MWDVQHRGVQHTLHHRGRTVDQLGHDLAQPLRTHRAGDLHRTHHIGEQHRHLLELRDWVADVTGVPHSLQNLAVPLN